MSTFSMSQLYSVWQQGSGLCSVSFYNLEHSIEWKRCCQNDQLKNEEVLGWEMLSEWPLLFKSVTHCFKPYLASPIKLEQTYLMLFNNFWGKCDVQYKLFHTVVNIQAILNHLWSLSAWPRGAQRDTLVQPATTNRSTASRLIPPQVHVHTQMGSVWTPCQFWAYWHMQEYRTPWRK